MNGDRCSCQEPVHHCVCAGIQERCENGCSQCEDWLGWAGVRDRIEARYYEALIDFAFALGELKMDSSKEL